MMNEKQQSLEDIVHQYGRALIVVDENGEQLHVIQPGGEKVDIDTEEDEYYSHGIELTENEKKSIAYLSVMDDESFDSTYSNDDNDDESAEELKVLFDVGFAFARRALTNRKRKKRRSLLAKDGEMDDTETKVAPCWDGYVQVGMKKGRKGKMVPNCVPEGQQKSFFLVEGDEETKSAGGKLKNPKGGLTAAGRAHFKKTEGANLKPGVKGAADTPEKMRRKGSFLTRFFTNPSGPMKDEKGRPTRLALSAAAWGEPVPQNASDAAELAAKGKRMLERYQNTKKKDYSEDIYTKNLGPTIGGGGGQEDATRDSDGDGTVNDGTENEKPAPKKQREPYKKLSNSFLEKRRRREVQRELKRQGITPTRMGRIVPEEDDEGQIQNQIYDRPEKERDARAAAREKFNQDADRKRFVRNQLRKQGITANAKKEDRDAVEVAARRAARAEYDRRVRAGEPKKPATSSSPAPKPKPPYPDGYEPGKPADRYPDPVKPNPNRAEEERMERLRPKPRDQKPADRYPSPSKPRDAEAERMERLRPPRREIKPADRYPSPKKPRPYRQGDMV